MHNDLLVLVSEDIHKLIAPLEINYTIPSRDSGLAPQVQTSFKKAAFIVSKIIFKKFGFFFQNYFLVPTEKANVKGRKRIYLVTWNPVEFETWTYRGVILRK